MSRTPLRRIADQGKCQFDVSLGPIRWKRPDELTAPPSLRTTVNGDARVDAYKLIAKTKTRIDDLLADLGDRVHDLGKRAADV
jgi:hypothetical protein